MAPRPGGSRRASAVAAERIRKARDVKGLTQGALADAVTQLGHPMHQSAIAKIEAGQRKITLDDLLVLAVALDVPPPLLFLPIDTDEDLALTPTKKAYSWRVWEWLHGEEPLPWSSTRAWSEGATPALLYAEVRDAQKAGNRSLLSIKEAEFEGDEAALRRAKRRYVATLRRLQAALEDMEREELPTARLIGGFRDDLERLGSTSEEEQA